MLITIIRASINILQHQKLYSYETLLTNRLLNLKNNQMYAYMTKSNGIKDFIIKVQLPSNPVPLPGSNHCMVFQRYTRCSKHMYNRYTCEHMYTYTFHIVAVYYAYCSAPCIFYLIIVIIVFYKPNILQFILLHNLVVERCLGSYRPGSNTNCACHLRAM